MAFWGSLLLPPPNFLFPVNPRLFFTNHLPANQLFLLYVSLFAAGYWGLIIIIIPVDGGVSFLWSNVEKMTPTSIDSLDLIDRAVKREPIQVL